jgi:2-polyprenyl-6-methoxyphenol hydroxylase-like FAD-dependent oxidoreductase
MSPVLIAGAGIAGLTCALALARRSLPVAVFERAERLDEIGAGIQFAPNATRVLIDLGLGERLGQCAVRPQEVRVMDGRNGRMLAHIPLGTAAEARYGAPYWALHRGDLQAALRERVETAAIELRLGTKVEEFTIDGRGIAVQVSTSTCVRHEHGSALIGADGVWSAVGAQAGDRVPRAHVRMAWRALIPADLAAPRWREQATCLWLGPDTHVVHYPVRNCAAINVVVFLREDRQQASKSEGQPTELLARIEGWHGSLRELLSIPERWSKWPLLEGAVWYGPPGTPVALAGDAAHPMLPFLAQGGAMAVEDAAVLADCLARTPDVPEQAFARYARLRRRRAARVLENARRNGTIYHLGGAAAQARNFVLQRLSGASLLERYDWLYGWHP